MTMVAVWGCSWRRSPACKGRQKSRPWARLNPQQRAQPDCRPCELSVESKTWGNIVVALQNDWLGLRSHFGWGHTGVHWGLTLNRTLEKSNSRDRKRLVVTGLVLGRRDRTRTCDLRFWRPQSRRDLANFQMSTCASDVLTLSWRRASPRESGTILWRFRMSGAACSCPRASAGSPVSISPTRCVP